MLNMTLFLRTNLVILITFTGKLFPGIKMKALVLLGDRSRKSIYFSSIYIFYHNAHKMKSEFVKPHPFNFTFLNHYHYSNHIGWISVPAQYLNKRLCGPGECTQTPR